LPPRCTTNTTIAACYWGILRYNQKPNITTIAEEKLKLHTNWEDGIVLYAGPVHPSLTWNGSVNWSQWVKKQYSV
jgi:hypothetical protein